LKGETMDIRHFMDIYGGEDFVHEMSDEDLVECSQKLKRALVFMCRADEDIEAEMKERRIGLVRDDCDHSLAKGLVGFWLFNENGGGIVNDSGCD